MSFLLRWCASPISAVAHRFADRVYEENLSPENRVLMSQLGEFTFVVIALLPQRVIDGEANGTGGLSSDLQSDEFELGWSRDGKGIWKRTRLPVIEIMDAGLQFLINKEDDVFGKANPATSFISDLLADPFPKQDEVMFLESNEKLYTLLKELRIHPTEAPSAFPPPLHDYLTGGAGDDMLTFICFYGGGANFLKEATEEDHVAHGPFVCDLPMSELEVRDGFRRYGARLHFDAQQNPTAIYDYEKKELIQPENELWEHAKLLVRVSIVTLMTAREHLLWTHILCANEVTLAKEKFLPPDHPVRRLLNIFTYRSNNINLAATETLLPELSLVHRGAAITYEAYKRVMIDGRDNSIIFQPFCEREFGKALEDLGEEFPFRTDGLEYYNIVYQFVSEWLDNSDADKIQDEDTMAFYESIQKSTESQLYKLPNFETKDDLCKLIAQFVWNVTAFHELVGNTVGDFTQFQDGWGLRIVDKATTLDLQTFLTGALITSLTGIRTPQLVSPFINYFGKGEAPEWERTVWDNFQGALKVQGDNVMEKNKTRRFNTKTFNPLQFECAVSV